MELEYADYRNPDQISMRCELSDWKTICSNPEMLKEIRRTTTVIEQITEILKGEYTAKLGVSNTLFLTLNDSKSTGRASGFTIIQAYVLTGGCG